MDDAQDQDDSIFVDHVVHDPVIADAQSMKGVSHTADGLDRLATDTPGLGDVRRELQQTQPDPRSRFGIKLLEDLGRRRRQPDVVGGQTRVSSATARPPA